MKKFEGRPYLREVRLNHARDTAGVECRKDADVLDETPRAYKSIEAVMASAAGHARERDRIDIEAMIATKTAPPNGRGSR